MPQINSLSICSKMEILRYLWLIAPHSARATHMWEGMHQKKPCDIGTSLSLGLLSPIIHSITSSPCSPLILIVALVNVKLPQLLLPHCLQCTKQSYLVSILPSLYSLFISLSIAALAFGWPPKAIDSLLNSYEYDIKAVS